MSSQNIYTYTPYFYIIEHIPSEMKYAGCRYAEGCYLEEFLRVGGYTTSSVTINQLIESDGFNSFKIIQILSEHVCGIPVYDYETRFLRDNKIAQRKDWLNYHNNDRGWHFWLAKHGVDAPIQLESVRSKTFATCHNRYGGNSSMSSIDIRTKALNTKMSRYGAYVSPNQQEKYKDTMLTRHGVDNAFLLPSRNETMLAKYGTVIPLHNQEIKDKEMERRILAYGGKAPCCDLDIARSKSLTVHPYRYETPYGNFPSKLDLMNHLRSIGISTYQLVEVHLKDTSRIPTKKQLKLYRLSEDLIGLSWYEIGFKKIPI